MEDSNDSSINRPPLAAVSIPNKSVEIKETRSPLVQKESPILVQPTVNNTINKPMHTNIANNTINNPINNPITSSVNNSISNPINNPIDNPINNPINNRINNPGHNTSISSFILPSLNEIPDKSGNLPRFDSEQTKSILELVENRLSYQDDAIFEIKEDLQNLQVEMIRQFYIQMVKVI